MSRQINPLTALSVHPASPVLLTKNGPLGAPQGRLTYLKFGPRRSRHESGGMIPNNRPNGQPFSPTFPGPGSRAFLPPYHLLDGLIHQLTSRKLGNKGSRSVIFAPTLGALVHSVMRCGSGSEEPFSHVESHLWMHPFGGGKTLLFLFSGRVVFRFNSMPVPWSNPRSNLP